MLFCEKPDSTFSQHALEHFPSKWMPVDRNMLYAPISMSAPGQLGPLHAIGGPAAYGETGIRDFCWASKGKRFYCSLFATGHRA
jgi:hypothetical protein